MNPLTYLSLILAIEFLVPLVALAIVVGAGSVLDHDDDLAGLGVDLETPDCMARLLGRVQGALEIALCERTGAFWHRKSLSPALVGRRLLGTLQCHKKTLRHILTAFHLVAKLTPSFPTTPRPKLTPPPFAAT